MNAAQPHRIIPGFDTFRAMAFLGVFLYHARILDCGYLGVQAFFVLSGYLLTPILIDMKCNHSFRSFVLTFYGRRALRIFPLYYMYLMVGGLIAIVLIRFLGTHTGETPLTLFRDQLVYGFAYIYNFFHATEGYEHTPYLSHFWSLAAEEQFYLVWPLLIWNLPVRALKGLLAMIIAITPLVRLMLYVIARDSLIPGIGGNPTIVVYVLPFSHCDGFAIGALASICKIRKISRAMAYGAIPMIALIGLAAEYLDTGSVHLNSLGYGPFMYGQHKLVWGYTLVNAGSALMILSIYQNAYPAFIVNNRMLMYLGKISYGLYVYHHAVVWLVAYHLAHLSKIARCSVALSLSILISIMSYELIEKRFLKMKDALFPRRPQ